MIKRAAKKEVALQDLLLKRGDEERLYISEVGAQIEKGQTFPLVKKRTSALMP